MAKHALPRTRRTVPTWLKITFTSVLWLLVLLGFVAWGLSTWTRREFGYVWVDQALMNLQGAGFEAGGKDLIISAFLWALVGPIAIWALLLTAWLLFRRYRNRKRRGAGAPLYTLAGAFVLLVVPVFGLSSLAATLQVGAYLESSRSALSLEDYYVEPEWAQPAESGENPPYNLIVIYLESVEDGLSDSDLFETDMLAPLADVTQDWQTIPTLTQYAGGGWTMAGILSTQCGVPYRLPEGMKGEEESINRWGVDQEEMIPGAVCLGDVLNSAGFQGVHLGGASRMHGGKDTFLLGHGYDTVYGKEEWVDLGETEFRDDWGLSDRRLFANAEKIVTELHQNDEPFFLSILTLDTHEKEHVYDYCEVTTQVPMESVYRCSVQQVADFVNYLESAGYLEDTAVIIMGDHVKMAGPQANLMNELLSLPQRPLFNRLWLPGGQVVAVDEADQLSLYATALEAVGLELVDGRAGAGVSVFQRFTPPGTIRDLDPQQRDLVTQSRSSDLYRQLWMSENSK